MPPRNISQSLNALPPGTVLRDYVIESELGSGGFSIVYLARHHLKSEWLYAIKEFLPAELAVRAHGSAAVSALNTEAHGAFEDGLGRFRDEAEQLRKFRNERYVVSCLNYFEENGTAYLVMDYDDGLPLSEFLEHREAAGWPVTEADLLAVMEPLLEGLTVVHRAGVLHRDIKPGNIFVRRQDDITGRPAHPVLIDFGAAKQNYLARHSRSQAPYTPGYAAYEQMSSTGEIGPWTDMYALGALMWRMVAGGCPGDSRLLVSDGANGEQVWSPTPRASEMRGYALHRGRPDPMIPAVELGVGRFSPDVLKAIDRCLALYPDDRVQDCGELCELVGANKAALSHASAKGSTSPDRQPERGVTDRLTRRPEESTASSSTNPTSALQHRVARQGNGPFSIPWPNIRSLALGAVFVLFVSALLVFEFQPYRQPAEQSSSPGSNGTLVADENTDSDPDDTAQAIDSIRRAAEQGDAGAQYNLAVIYYNGERVPEDMTQAAQWFRRAAEQGHATAQFNLGVMYANGEGVPEDDAQAVEWYRRVAEQGHATAQFNLGVMYDNGEGVPEDDAQAVEWYRRAAEQGHAGAHINLGLMYDAGEGVPMDSVQAAEWFRRAAEQGNTDAQFELSRRYYFGEGVAEDKAQAAEWLGLAAKQGHIDAQTQLGIMHYNGDGITEDKAQAAEWLGLAAGQGASPAQARLGSMYYYGDGIPEDKAQAAQWLRLAAEQGDAPSQFLLGNLYYDGLGVPTDFVQAYAWVNLALASLTPAQSLRSLLDEIVGEMTNEQIAEAQRLTREIEARIQR